MIILGIDPGSRKTGYALIEVHGRKMSYLESGLFKLEDEENFTRRLPIAYSNCIELCNRLRPDEAALESLIYVKSPTALIKLAQTRGAMVAALESMMPGKLYEYSPNLIKSSVSGHGHASKEGIQKTLSLFFGEKKFKSSDESDALAVALCHALNRNSYLHAKEKLK